MTTLLFFFSAIPSPFSQSLAIMKYGHQAPLSASSSAGCRSGLLKKGILPPFPPEKTGE
jgi:hypothetical protein